MGAYLGHEKCGTSDVDCRGAKFLGSAGKTLFSAKNTRIDGSFAWMPKRDGCSHDGIVDLTGAHVQLLRDTGEVSGYNPWDGVVPGFADSTSRTSRIREMSSDASNGSRRARNTRPACTNRSPVSTPRPGNRRTPGVSGTAVHAGRTTVSGATTR